MSSSNVGNAQVYEAGDQRVPPDSQKSEKQSDPYNEGKENSHKDNDPSTPTSSPCQFKLYLLPEHSFSDMSTTNSNTEDERSIANRLAAAGSQNDSESGKADAEAKMSQQDPTLPAKAHGNEPSKGAKIDAELQAEEEQMLAKKDAASGGNKGGTGKQVGQKN